MAKEKYSDVVLESAVVVDVDPALWTATVQTEYSDKTIPDVPWAFPYSHPLGEGILYVPEPGTKCILATPSDEDESPFILMFHPIHDNTGSFGANRPRLGPGDLSVVTRDGSGIVCRRGGVLELLSGGVTRRQFFAAGNLLRDVTINYEHRNGGGELFWGLKDDSRGVFQLYIKTEAGQEEAPIRVRLGNLSKEYFSFVVENPQRLLSVSLGKDGHLSVKGEDLSVEWKSVSVRVAGKTSISTDSLALSCSSASFAVDTHEMNGASSIERLGKKQIEASVVTLGHTLSATPLLKAPDAIAALSIPLDVDVIMPGTPPKILKGTARLTPAALLKLIGAATKNTKAS